MTISDNGLKLIESFEGCVLHAYNDPASGGLPITIGWGNTINKDGTRFKLGDTLTQDEADELLKWSAGNVATVVNSLLKSTVVNQNQFDALVCFTYNVGIGALTSSTLLKKVRMNAADATITTEFLRWNKAAGKVNQGLTTRRRKEAAYYFS